MLSYRVVLDVPVRLALFVARLLAAHRREIGTHRGTRALSSWRQAVFALAWFRDRPDVARLGKGFGIFQATAYRYVKRPAGGGELDLNTQTRNALLRSLRCLGERGFALLTQRWRTLQRVMLSPGKIGSIAQATLVLAQFGHKMITCKC